MSSESETIIADFGWYISLLGDTRTGDGLRGVLAPTTWHPFFASSASIPVIMEAGTASRSIFPSDNDSSADETSPNGLTDCSSPLLSIESKWLERIWEIFQEEESNVPTIRLFSIASTSREGAHLMPILSGADTR